MDPSCIYLDYNATTPIDKEVQQAMLPYLTSIWGNPSSNHPYGQQAKEGVQLARKQMAQLLNCEPDEVVFTSGGTESNNYAIKGAALANKHRGKHIITCQIEHPAVVEVCEYLKQSNGFEITYLPVDKTGVVSVKELEAAITPQTVLVTIMHSNNEVGTLQPIAEIAKVLKRHPGIIFHTDASQSIGKVPVKVDELGVDLLTIAGHKLYAPKGVGCLYVRNGVKLEKFMHGASHEKGRRAGTENLLLVVGLGHAAQVAERDFVANATNMKNMRSLLYHTLCETFPDIKLNTPLEYSLPNTLNVSFKGIKSDELIQHVRQHLAISAGAACHSGTRTLSATLTAMGLAEDDILGAVRFSTGRATTSSDIHTAVGVLKQAIASLRDKQ